MRQKYLPALFLLLLFLGASLISLKAAKSANLSYQEEAALFSLAELGPVDLSPKTVTVEVYVSPAPELRPFQQLLPHIWPKVQDFYARMGVLLRMVPGHARSGPLEARTRIRLEALTHKEWLARTYQAFKVEPPFRFRFLKICQDKYAFAHLHLSTIHLDARRFQEEICGGGGKKNQPLRTFAHLLIHELGHLFGLYHAHEFINDPIPEFLPDGRTPNFMSQHLVGFKDLGFTDWQRRLVHSFLSGGKVFQQYRQVDFDSLRYLELVKVHNGYLEPPQGKPRLLIKPLAFGDNEDEDDEDDDDFHFGGRGRLTRCR